MMANERLMKSTRIRFVRSYRFKVDNSGAVGLTFQQTSCSEQPRTTRPFLGRQVCCQLSRKVCYCGFQVRQVRVSLRQQNHLMLSRMKLAGSWNRFSPAKAKRWD